MAAKRFLEEHDHEQPAEKRMRPSLSSIIREVVMVNSMGHLCSALEPLIRKVVREELERVMRLCSGSLTLPPPINHHALEPASLQLCFSKKLLLPIFTGSKIVDLEGSGLEIVLTDTKGNRASLPALKVEIVVVDGDFPEGERWSSEEFEKKIVRERTGKRPLLAGEVNVTMREGLVGVGEVEFTDNSSWIRSRKFRVGARVVSHADFRIREAVTEAFVVKDHRGELYKKHHPPSLDDEVWRLEKIGKEGAFHKKLSSERINTVQDFLKLSVVDPSKLRRVLGAGMSEKMWEVTIKHARECEMGTKLYLSKGHNYTIFLNPICQLVKAIIDGRVYPTPDLSIFNRSDIEKLVREAYNNWDSLEPIDAVVNETPLLTQGEIVDPNLTGHHKQIQTNGYVITSNEHPTLTNGCNNWQLSSAYIGSPFESCFRYGIIEESSSEGDLTPSGSKFSHADS